MNFCEVLFIKSISYLIWCTTDVTTTTDFTIAAWDSKTTTGKIGNEKNVLLKITMGIIWIGVMFILCVAFSHIFRPR
ncbi:unnamed protein product [Clavelina lepadiformis]|uniref:Uncharacterized protein n=1 Tax=Clavelina lepadiformis TaxID=159417 RepID=A0ABP0GEY4_CLALP